MPDPKSDPRSDPEPIATSTRIRDQASLTTSSGKSWLILGGLLSLIAVAVLIPLLSAKPHGLGLFGLCSIVALYAAMVVVRLNMHPGRGMLGALAALMIAIAIIGLISIGLIAGTTGNVVLD